MPPPLCAGQSVVLGLHDPEEFDPFRGSPDDLHEKAPLGPPLYPPIPSAAELPESTAPDLFEPKVTRGALCLCVVSPSGSVNDACEANGVPLLPAVLFTVASSASLPQAVELWQRYSLVKANQSFSPLGEASEGDASINSDRCGVVLLSIVL